MAQYQISLNQTPNQEFSFTVGEHSLNMSLRTTTAGLFADLSVDGSKVFSGHRCCNKMPLLFKKTIDGNIYFLDMYGDNDPVYEELNTRFFLIYDEDYVL